MNEYDTENIEPILNGHGDWFNAHLLRLIATADSGNTEKLRVSFPEQVEAVLKFRGY
jgi:hypothetical protein